MITFRDRCFCLRTRGDTVPHGMAECANTQCDRFAGPEVLRLAERSRLPIGWADLLTSKCGFVPLEGEK